MDTQSTELLLVKYDENIRNTKTAARINSAIDNIHSVDSCECGINVKNLPV
jgi:hypothetical protein